MGCGVPKNTTLRRVRKRRKDTLKKKVNWGKVRNLGGPVGREEESGKKGPEWIKVPTKTKPKSA